MSKFLDSLQIQTSRRVLRKNDFVVSPFPYPFKDMTLQEYLSDRESDCFSREYTMSIGWYFKSHCDEGIERTAAMDAIKQLALHNLRDAIYGEFKDELTKLYIAIEERDVLKSKQIMINILEMIR